MFARRGGLKFSAGRSIDYVRQLSLTKQKSKVEGNMRKLIVPHNHYDEEHLKEVIEEMRVRGAPTIKAYTLGFDDLVQAVQ